MPRGRQGISGHVVQFPIPEVFLSATFLTEDHMVSLLKLLITPQ